MVMSTKPSLLYITPVIPALTGNGLAMRAGTVLEVLAECHDVDLLVVPLYAPVTREIPGPLEELCRRATIIAPRPPRRGGLLRAGRWRAPRFDVVHVFRLATLPFSEPYLQGFFRRPRRHLDLDDIESLTRRRLASLYRQNGATAMAAREELEAARCVRLEDEAFRNFDRMYVCSASDRGKLEGRTRAEVRVLPNAVRLPASIPARGAEGVFTFFFVGTLGYYPNEDGVRYLCAEIVPRLRELAGRNFVVNIAGTGASESLRQAASVPQVRFLGAAADIHPWYAQADAVVAPLRAGGGTRIKILEAFSYQRPVVATSVAIEGIEARAEEHVVIGDTPGAFAQQCARLMADGELRERLARNALALLQHFYTIPSLRRALEGK
jgi:glycosyltransferase involved in cell wall biosynthesis